MKKIIIFVILILTALSLFSADYVTIAQAREKEQLKSVVIRGKVTAEPGVFDINIMFVQDETAGINIYSQALDLTKLGIKRGDYVEVYGYLWFHKSNLELVVDDSRNIYYVKKIENLNYNIEPLNIKTKDINEESLEGYIVKTEGKIVSVDSQSFSINDGSGEGIVWIRENTGIDTTIFKEGIKVKVTGTLAQYLSTKELWPRDIKDIEADDMFPPEAKYYSINGNRAYVMFNEPIKENLVANKSLMLLKNKVTEIKYLSEGKMVEITAENNIDNKIIFRYLEDLNGNKINILSFDYNEKNLKSNSVIFDESHGQTAGNADWTISTGFSDMGDQLVSMGKGVYSEKAEISKDVLNMFNVLVIPEPNKPFTKEEEKIITDFVKNGGKLFLIGDHGGADRNGNGWDAVKIFNNFVGEFGFTFAGDDLEEAPLKNICKHDITYNIKEIGVWNGSSFLLKKDNIEVLIADKDNKPFLILTDYYNGKIIAIGDSSPFDDGTGTSGKMLHNGWQWGDDEELSYNIFNYLTSY